MGKKAKIIILILSMLVIGLLAFIVTDKFILNKNKSTTSTGNTSVNHSTNEVADVVNNTTDSGKNENNEIKEQTTNPEKKKSETKKVDEVKKTLKDKDWLAKNVLVQSDENYDNQEIGTQIVKFIVCKKSSDIPVVVIQVNAEDIRYSKVILVTYSDKEQKVVVRKINEGHIYHGAYTVDANKCVVNSLFKHGGSEATMYHSVADGELKFIGEYGSNSEYENGEEVLKYFVQRKNKQDDPEFVSESEYQEYKDSLNEKQYKFVEIGTELNDSNIDNYIK